MQADIIRFPKVDLAENNLEGGDYGEYDLCK